MLKGYAYENLVMAESLSEEKLGPLSFSQSKLKGGTYFNSGGELIVV